MKRDVGKEMWGGKDGGRGGERCGGSSREREVGRERWGEKVEVNQYQSYPNMHTVTRQWIS